METEFAARRAVRAVATSDRRGRFRPLPSWHQRRRLARIRIPQLRRGSQASQHAPFESVAPAMSRTLQHEFNYAERAHQRARKKRDARLAEIKATTQKPAPGPAVKRATPSGPNPKALEHLEGYRSMVAHLQCHSAPTKSSPRTLRGHNRGLLLGQPGQS